MDYLADTVTVIRHFSGVGRIGRKAKTILEGVEEGDHHDLRKRRPEDPNKININQPWEVNHWCSKFGVSVDILKKAVKAAGTSVNEVEKGLRCNGHI
ncbi:MAG: DUF3606 domain-containing protein [Candidatus Desulfaltia sp.]|nr:DUF3606 domain-containing protein [Candidatus Desulfaltia sp.]